MSAVAVKPKLEGYTSFDEIKKVVAAFESCTLPRAQWTHAAHLTIAFWYLVCYPLPEAAAKIRAGIQRYNEAQGIKQTKDGGYHETITLFWIRLVRHYLTTATLEGHLVVLLNEMLRRYDRQLPFAYYSRDRLLSWEARQHWLEPDLKALP
ncbi:MAG: hypothetical protein HYR56_03600 [Acidobacteria bacterium]|nr:hypothetical protein [Acidobacteriota bacterium]MBI3427013.1 hypothetical protein [Acidobacteriota bacterium]